jgi:hypothetical protein
MLILGLIVVALIALSVKLGLRVHQLKEKYGPIEDVDAEVVELYQKKITLEAETQQLARDKREAEETVKLYEDTSELIELGLYTPQFDFETSEVFKLEVDKCRQYQRDLIKNKRATNCPTSWTVEGSASKGKAMMTRTQRMMLRAFNNECDALILKCKWDNVAKQGLKIEKAFETINRLNESYHLSITSSYLNEKLRELRLVHEYHTKKQEEKEEQAAIRDQIREEKRAEKEYQDAIRRSEKEEKTYETALARARKEASAAVGGKLTKLQETIQKLEHKLAHTVASLTRAKSMAQMTKCGYIYVISNIGCFGEGVFKIGMTRRLDPMDRVHELGNASVPFRFDVHAMISASDAPKLEKALHNFFDDKRVNRVNKRKEFFNASLDEIEYAVKGLADKPVEFIRTAIAQEFRESQKLLSS